MWLSGYTDINLACGKSRVWSPPPLKKWVNKLTSRQINIDPNGKASHQILIFCFVGKTSAKTRGEWDPPWKNKPRLKSTCLTVVHTYLSLLRTGATKPHNPLISWAWFLCGLQSFDKLINCLTSRRLCFLITKRHVTRFSLQCFPHKA